MLPPPEVEALGAMVDTYDPLAETWSPAGSVKVRVKKCAGEREIDLALLIFGLGVGFITDRAPVLCLFLSRPPK